jgi:hypothetical protein
MKRIVTGVVAGVLLLLAGVVSTAFAQVVASDTAKLKAGDPQEASVNVHAEFTSIDSACFNFTFAAENGLDPGESLLITPTGWLKDFPVDRGPGFVNVTGATQFNRTLCPVNFPGLPTDRLLDELLDGKEHLVLHADDGPVIVTNLDVTIVGGS